MRPRFKTILLAVLGFAIVMAAAVALLPFFATKIWFVRLLDFPRLQGLIVTGALLLPLPFLFKAHRRAVLGAALLGLVAIAAHVAVLWPYLRFDSAFRVDASCPADRLLRVMISNVLLTNRDSKTLLAEVAAEKPDIFLAMEIDDWWDRTLEPLTASLPYTAKKITGSYYGIRLFSRLPLVTPDIRFFAGRDTPAVTTGVTLPNGETVTFIGMHPRPPLPGQSALPRDAELYAAGEFLRDRPGPAVLAGDLNATPWEDALSRLRRIAGLVDPRRGHGYAYTFDATSWWAKWPLDQVFYRPGFDLLSFARLGPIGSDHYPFAVHLCRDPNAKDDASPSESDDDRERLDEARRAAATERLP